MTAWVYLHNVDPDLVRLTRRRVVKQGRPTVNRANRRLMAKVRRTTTRTK